MTDFNLESQSSCNYDYLEISDASGYSSGRLCGDEGLGYTYVSVGNNVTVVFHTDYSVRQDGFCLHYEAVTGKLSFVLDLANYFCGIN